MKYRAGKLSCPVVIFFWYLSDGCRNPTVGELFGIFGGCPDSGILQNLADGGIVIGGECLVSGTEIEDLTSAAAIAYATAEDLSACEPAYENGFVGLGNNEMLAIGLFGRKNDLISDSLGNGMTGVAIPKDLLVVALAPFEVVGICSHQLAEDLRCMSRVKNNKTHTLHNSAVDLVNDLVGNFFVSAMSPPKENVGLGKNLVGKSVFRLIQNGSSNLKALCKKIFGNSGVHTVGIYLFEDFFSFVSVFIPNSNIHFKLSLSA